MHASNIANFELNFVKKAVIKPWECLLFHVLTAFSLCAIHDAR